MFQLSNVARRSFSRGLITGRVKISQISKFNNSLKELKDDVKNVSKKLNEIETKVQEDGKKVSKKLNEIETKVQEDGKKVSKKLDEIETNYWVGVSQAERLG
ncbi:hypothetical protein C1645_736303 [Glomus cerebriforme]|uniref:Uncharacterized protein n=1 Tax=Glomus cerebriforme TaxID=658196 RepID=A0A397T874_9GLOM|nr:hypothetical protein C1645_736303 [Glomus cerebriforme]